MGATPIEAALTERRQRIAVGDPPQGLNFYTAEDPLRQLRWFRPGGEVSDRQLRDCLAIVLVQGERLDLEYLRASASIPRARLATRLLESAEKLFEAQNAQLWTKVSDRQWRDVLAIVAVQGERLDLEYLRRSARVIGVEALLERVLTRPC